MSAPASRRISPWWAALACAVAGVVLFQAFGNASRGYVQTSSTFWWWISQWLDPQADAEHGWLILAISGWLVARNLRAERGEGRKEQDREKEKQGAACREQERAGRAAEFAEDRRPAGIPAAGGHQKFWILNPGFLSLLAGLALHAGGFVAQQTRFSIVGLLLFTWGVLRLGGGKRWGDAARFPLGFMVFAIPLNVLDSLGFWLRLWVVDGAELFARLVGIELTRTGTQLFSPDGRYQYDVAAACSGVRSLMALAALSLLIGYLNFRSSWRRGLLLALCFPLTYLGNFARIAAILVAAQIGGQIWGERAHAVMGFGVFAIVLGGVLGAAAVIRRWWPEDEWRGIGAARRKGRTKEAFGLSSRGRTGRQHAAARDGNLAAPVLAIAGLVIAVGEMFFLANVVATPASLSAGVRLEADGRNPVDLPAFIGTEWIGQRTEVTAVERQILPADTGFARRNYVQVEGGAHAVLFSIVLSGRDRTSIHRPELCLVGQGWTIHGSSRRRLTWAPRPGGTLPVTLLHTELTQPESGRRLPALTAYCFVNSETVVATHWERFGHDAWARIRHGRADRWAYVLLQTDALDGEAAAWARMEAVLQGVWPSLAGERLRVER